MLVLWIDGVFVLESLDLYVYIIGCDDYAFRAHM
jgi:hypothetical protein